MPRVKSVFELMDPDGHIYVLQAHDAQFPIESLAKLGEQMKQLPQGLAIPGQESGQGLMVQNAAGNPGIQDDFRNPTSFCRSAALRFFPEYHGKEVRSHAE